MRFLFQIFIHLVIDQALFGRTSFDPGESMPSNPDRV